MLPPPENGGNRRDEEIAERLDSLATWINEIDARLGAAELKTGDEKTAKELRRAIEAMAKHDPKLESRLTNRVDVLADRLATLASAVSTTAASVAGKEGEIASLKRELNEGGERIQTLVQELGRAAGAAEVEELRSAIRVLSDESPRRTGDQRIDDLNAKVAFFSERLDTLSKTVATTASGLAGREGDVAVIRQKLEDGSARVESAIGELRQLQGESSLTERLDSLESAIATTNTDLAGGKRDIAAVRARLDEAYSRVGSAFSDLQRSIAALSSRAATLEQFPEATERLERRLAEVAERQDAVERDRDVGASELTGSGAAWAEERAWVRGELEKLAAAHAVSSQSTESLGPLLQTLTSRVDDMEGERGIVAAEVVRVRDALDAQSVLLRTQLDAVAARLEQTAAADPRDDSEHLLGELVDRLTRVEQSGAATAAEVTRAAAHWSSALDSIGERLAEISSGKGGPATSYTEDTARMLDQLTGRLDSMERDRHAVMSAIAGLAESWTSERSSLESRLDELSLHLVRVQSGAREAPTAASSENEVAQLRILVDGLRARLASSEQELAALAGSRDVGARVDELSRRIESVERLGPVVVASSGGPAAGDGRFRLELRALELRMEYAEAASRQNREAVLVQLERLASRVEWRLQRLESDEADTYPHAANTGANVVPIRGVEV